jgi:hypothetical protein
MPPSVTFYFKRIRHVRPGIRQAGVTVNYRAVFASEFSQRIGRGILRLRHFWLYLRGEIEFGPSGIKSDNREAVELNSRGQRPRSERQHASDPERVKQSAFWN